MPNTAQKRTREQTADMDSLEQILELDLTLQIADIGAAVISEEPPYQPLIDSGLAHLHAFDAEERNHHALRLKHGEKITVHSDIIGDGHTQILHIANIPESGMTSLLKPSQSHLEFFNGFEDFGAIKETTEVKTIRLDDVSTLPPIDYLKIDIQGGELQALQNGTQKLANCVAVQMEISFVQLYENQPRFGEVDVWMQSQGFMPHSFADIKRWSIAPTIRNNDIKQPFNQLLEADIVYIRDPIEWADMSYDAMKKLVLIAHHCYSSVDLAIHLIKKLEEANEIPKSSVAAYVEFMRTPKPQ